MDNLERKLAGRTALVTGSARGLGRGAPSGSSGLSAGLVCVLACVIALAVALAAEQAHPDPSWIEAARLPHLRPVTAPPAGYRTSRGSAHVESQFAHLVEADVA